MTKQTQLKSVKTRVNDRSDYKTCLSLFSDLRECQLSFESSVLLSRLGQKRELHNRENIMNKQVFIYMRHSVVNYFWSRVPLPLTLVKQVDRSGILPVVQSRIWGIGQNYPLTSQPCQYVLPEVFQSKMELSSLSSSKVTTVLTLNIQFLMFLLIDSCSYII